MIQLQKDGREERVHVGAFVDRRQRDQIFELAARRDTRWPARSESLAPGRPSSEDSPARELEAAGLSGSTIVRRHLHRHRRQSGRTRIPDQRVGSYRGDALVARGGTIRHLLRHGLLLGRDTHRRRAHDGELQDTVGKHRLRLRGRPEPVVRSGLASERLLRDQERPAPAVASKDVPGGWTRQRPHLLERCRARVGLVVRR